MRGQIERLTKLSTDLLDLSRLDADALSLQSEPIDLTEVANEVAAEFAAAAERHGSDIEVESEGPRDRLPKPIGRGRRRSCVSSSTTPSSTPLRGTQISITSSITPTEIRLTVSDDGPGIDPRSEERIFERFYTADSVGGSGLGLAIARELARAMGGDVVLEAERRRGASFNLTLPSGGAASRTSDLDGPLEAKA